MLQRGVRMKARGPVVKRTRFPSVGILSAFSRSLGQEFTYRNAHQHGKSPSEFRTEPLQRSEPAFRAMDRRMFMS